MTGDIFRDKKPHPQPSPSKGEGVTVSPPYEGGGKEEVNYNLRLQSTLSFVQEVVFLFLALKYPAVATIAALSVV